MIAILHWLNSDTDSGFSQNFKTELAYQSARFPNDFINSISFGFQLLNVKFFFSKTKKALHDRKTNYICYFVHLHN